MRRAAVARSVGKRHAAARTSSQPTAGPGSRRRASSAGGCPVLPPRAAASSWLDLASTRRGEQKDTACCPLRTSAFSSLTSPAAEAARQLRACSGTRHGVKRLIRRPLFVQSAAKLIVALPKRAAGRKHRGRAAPSDAPAERRDEKCGAAAAAAAAECGPRGPAARRRRQEGSGWEHPALRRLGALTREDPSPWLPLWRPAQICWKLQGTPQPAQGEDA